MSRYNQELSAREQELVRRAHGQQLTTWARNFPAEHKWLEHNASAGNAFAQSLLNGLQRFGSLTPNQLACVQRSVARDVAEVAAREPLVLTPTASAPEPGLDLSKLPDGYYAVPDGDTRLKVRVNRPKPPSRWAGTTFVSDGAAYGQRKNYGRQSPGGFYKGDIVDALRRIIADPYAASAAYGKLTGTCGVCGRHLEDKVSIERGIGPVCYGRFDR